MNTKKERNEQIFLLRTHGQNFREIGLKFGIGAQRTRDVYLKVKRSRERGPEWDDGLDTRSANVLNNMDIVSKEDAVKAIKEGRLRPGKARHYGFKTHQLLCQWLGLPIPTQKKKQGRAPLIRMCPECLCKYMIKI